MFWPVPDRHSLLVTVYNSAKPDGPRTLQSQNIVSCVSFAPRQKILQTNLFCSFISCSLHVSVPMNAFDKVWFRIDVLYMLVGAEVVNE
jgi:hypothetical protein